MQYCKVELINGRVYDFDKKCTSFILNKDGYTVFIKDKELGGTDVLMYINKTEIRRIEWVNDSEEVENLSNQESKIEWITDRNPTVEECGYYGDNRFLVTALHPTMGIRWHVDTFNNNGSWHFESVIAWAKVTPYKKE